MCDITMMNVTQSYLLTSEDTTEMADLDIPLASLPLFRLSVSLWMYCSSAVLLLGTFGNVMSIVIMRRMMTKESTINLFFIALAVGDLLLLYAGSLMKWTELDLGVDNWPALFFPVLWIYLSAGGYGSWVLVCITLQRAMSVAWPHHVSRIFTRRRVVKVIVGVAVFQLLFYAHHLYCVYVSAATSMTGTQCIRLRSFSYVKFLDVFIYFATALTSMLPFVCLVLGNGVLVTSLIRSVREARGNIVLGNTQQNVKRKKNTNSVTVTIIVVSLTFIVLTLPVFIHSCLYRFREHKHMSVQTRAEVFLYYTISSLMYFSNSAINFVLYCLTGRRFRQEFVRVLACREAKSK